MTTQIDQTAATRLAVTPKARLSPPVEPGASNPVLPDGRLPSLGHTQTAATIVGLTPIPRVSPPAEPGAKQNLLPTGIMPPLGHTQTAATVAEVTPVLALSPPAAPRTNAPMLPTGAVSEARPTRPAAANPAALPIAEMSPPVPTPSGETRSALSSTRPVSPHVATIAEIRETHRLRGDMLRAEVALTLRIKAQARRLGGDQSGRDTHRSTVVAEPAGEGQGSRDAQSVSALPGTDEGGRGGLDTQHQDAALSPSDASEGHSSGDIQPMDADLASLAAIPLIEARAVLRTQRLRYERRMAQLAKLLPVYPWVKSVRGFGELSLAQIVGECGDLDNYAGPAKVWKRMGLAVIDGGRQRRVAGAAALDHGYAPYRRSLMWNVGEALIKLNQGGPYRTYYLEEKKRQREKLGEEAAQAHVHNRAKRHMEKRLLRDLWKVWREVGR